MKILSFTYRKKLFFAFFGIIFLLCRPIYGLSSSEKTLENTDITRVGMNMYTTARQWETASASGYTADGFKGFSKKLNTALKGHPELKKFFGKGYCDGCDSIVSDGLDEALVKYQQNNPPTTTTGELPYVSLVKKYLDSRVLGPMSQSDVQALDTLVGNMVRDISQQTLDQMDYFRDVSGMGLYYDGDVDNSPYDLLDDIRRIDEIFFREAPEFGSYKNTSANDASALITGKVSTGTWGGGENYNIDLLSDVSKAFGGDGGSTSGGGSSGGNGEIAGDCDSGYCITIDFIQNSHYFLGSGSGGKGKNSFQGLFEEGLDWIIKNGDNRNFACKVSPTINTWESEFDLNVMLKNLFSSGVHVFWKTPPFLQGFARRNSDSSSKTDTSTEGKSSQTQASRKVLDSLESAFKKRGMNFDKPTNIKSSTSQAVEYVTTKNAQTNVPVSETVYAVNRSETDMQQLLLAEGSSIERPFIHEKNVDSIKHMEKTFDEVESRTRSFYDIVKGMKTIFDYILTKDDCQPS